MITEDQQQERRKEGKKEQRRSAGKYLLMFVGIIEGFLYIGCYRMKL